MEEKMEREEIRKRIRKKKSSVEGFLNSVLAGRHDAGNKKAKGYDEILARKTEFVFGKKRLKEIEEGIIDEYLDERNKEHEALKEKNSPQALKESGVAEFLNFLDNYPDAAPIKKYSWTKTKSMNLQKLLPAKLRYGKDAAYISSLQAEKQNGTLPAVGAEFLEIQEMVNEFRKPNRYGVVYEFGETRLVKIEHGDKIVTQIHANDVDGKPIVLNFPPEQYRTILSRIIEIQEKRRNVEKEKNKTDIIALMQQKMSQKDM